MVNIELLHILLFQRIRNYRLYRVLITIQTPSTVEGFSVEFFKRKHIKPH